MNEQMGFLNDLLGGNLGWNSLANNAGAAYKDSRGFNSLQRGGSNNPNGLLFDDPMKDTDSLLSGNMPEQELSWWEKALAPAEEGEKYTPAPIPKAPELAPQSNDLSKLLAFASAKNGQGGKRSPQAPVFGGGYLKSLLGG